MVFLGVFLCFFFFFNISGFSSVSIKVFLSFCDYRFFQVLSKGFLLELTRLKTHQKSVVEPSFLWV